MPTAQPWASLWYCGFDRLFKPHRTGKTRLNMSERKLISIDDARHVAKLARLDVDDARLQRLTTQLESILEYVNQIARVDLTSVEPMAHALPLHNVFREDVIEPSLPIEKVLMNAPDTDGNFFKVPKVLGTDEDSAG
jgi:aspartyl-tRNA(Asn)/glutamyl-tRNA(Gln) amidotransferase subunit C